MWVTARVHAFFLPLRWRGGAARASTVRRFRFLILLFGTGIGMTRSEPIMQARSESVSRIVARPLTDEARPGQRIGDLRFVSGYALTSADPRFGGISAMARTSDGFLALSDSGTVMTLSGANGRLSALRLRPLPNGPGDPATKSDRDSEALTRDPQGRVWAAFERHNSVWRYAPGFGPAQANRAPPEMRRWRANSGAEAMVRLEDGRFLLFSEGAGRVPRSSDVLLFDRDPTHPRARAARLSYRLPEGFSVTDAALLGDGRLATLHRRVSLSTGFVASLGVASLAAFRPGAVVEPRIAATLSPPFPVDNMEALAVDRREGATRLWIASDDNFSALQRTLLLHFEFAGQPG